MLACYALMMPGDFRLPGATREQLEAALRSGREQSTGFKAVFSSFLFSHNVKVGILSLASGVFVAFPTILLLIYNGAMLGAFTFVHHNAGIYDEYWAWILPHGITELGAIVLCGGVGLSLGMSVLSPGYLSVTERLKNTASDAAAVCGGIVIMLFFAAIIESFVRQSEMTTSSRLIFAGGTAIFWTGYLATGFQRRSGNDSRP